MSLVLKKSQGCSVASYHEYHYANCQEYDPTKIHLVKVESLIKRFCVVGRLLDVGCGDGSFALRLQKLGFSVNGVDISKKAVEKAKSNGVIAVAADVSSGFPFQSSSFDCLVACEIIEHVYDTDFFLHECFRVLRSNGLLFLTTPNLASFPNRLLLLFNKYPRFVPEYRVGGAGHIRAYTLPVLLKQLKESGFDVVHKSCANVPFPMLSRFVPNLAKRFAMFLGEVFPNSGSHIIVVVRKKSI